MNALMGSDSNRLWSLWDMMRVYAHHYLDIGEHAQNIKIVFGDAEGVFENRVRRNLHADEVRHVKEGLEKLLLHCDGLDLPISSSLIKSRLEDMPQSSREFDILVSAVYAELKTKLFLFIRPHLAKFYDNHDVLTHRATLAFPNCRNELWDASNSLTSGLWTAAVFHAMRAAEIGVRVLAADLGVSFPDKTIEQAEWATLVDQAEAKIKAIAQRQKTAEREKEQHFYSTAAAQFRYFKDGWRVRVAHAKASYSEDQAIKIFEHTRDFFETLSERLKE
jgi:hypothetical protein